MEVIVALLAGLTLTTNNFDGYVYFDAETRTFKDNTNTIFTLSSTDLDRDWYEYTPPTTITLRTVLLQSTDGPYYTKLTATSAYLEAMENWTVVKEFGVETIDLKG